MTESSNRFIALDKPVKKYIEEEQNTEKDSSKNLSTVDDKEFYQARKCLEARSKRLTEKQGKGNKSNAAEAMTVHEVNILYEKYLRQSTCTQTE